VILRVDRLLGRQVWTANNKRLGRLHELCAEPQGGEVVIVEFMVGAAGLLQRLQLGVRLLAGLKRSGGYAVRWDQLDLSTPERPRLRCPIAALRRL